MSDRTKRTSKQTKTNYNKKINSRVYSTWEMLYKLKTFSSSCF